MNIIGSREDKSLIEIQKMCAGCKYYAITTKSCDYYLVTKQHRGCEIGECDKFDDGKLKIKRSNKPLKPIPKDEWLDYMRTKKKGGAR